MVLSHAFQMLVFLNRKDTSKYEWMQKKNDRGVLAM